jgi:aminopeptidase-like protein
LILPETIGAICFLSQAMPQNIIGGMILSCLAGPDELSLKEGFDKNHWINKAAHQALKDIVGSAITVTVN